MAAPWTVPPSCPTAPVNATSIRSNLVWRVLADPTTSPLDVDVLRFLSPDGNVLEQRTRGDLLDEVCRFGGWLSRQGVRPGETVVVHAPVDRHWPALFLGTIAIGAVAFPVPTDLPPGEKDRWLAHARVDWTVGTPWPSSAIPTLEVVLEQVMHARPTDLHPVHDHSPAFMLTTSGTEGRPRSVLHAHGSWRGRDASRNHWSRLQVGDVLLHSASVQWSYALGLSLMDGPRHGACTLLPLYRPAREDWAPLLRRHEATVFAGVPGLLGHLLRHHGPAWRQPPSLQRTLCAGEALDPALATAWREHTGAPVNEAFGMTECSTYLTGGDDGTLIPQPGRRISILPLNRGTTPLPLHVEGELAIHREEPGLMLRYAGSVEPDRWRGPWFLTGDFACRLPGGRLRLLGREATRLNPGGYRVSAIEVENTLGACSGVEEVAVTEAIRHDGVRLLAACVVGDHRQRMRWEATLENDLPPWKRPRFYVDLPALPRTARGKIDRKAVSEHVARLHLWED